MRTKQYVSLGKRLLQHLPGFAIKGKLLFMSDVGHTLRGFFFESSAFAAKSFYVNVFFQPLYVPAERIHFTFGHRLGIRKRWSADQPGLDRTMTSAMIKETPFLASLNRIEGVVKALAPLTKGNNPHCHEAFAYTLAKAGEIPAAVDAIDVLLTLVDRLMRANPALTWELEIAARAGSLKNKLMVNPAEAQVQLAEWESETVHNLGLEEFWLQSS